MANVFIKIETPDGSETIRDIDAAVVVALRDDADSIGAKISTLSSDAIDQRHALMFSLQPIAAKIRALGRCCQECENCARVFRIADGIDALIEAEATTGVGSVLH